MDILQQEEHEADMQPLESALNESMAGSNATNTKKSSKISSGDHGWILSSVMQASWSSG